MTVQDASGQARDGQAQDSSGRTRVGSVQDASTPHLDVDVTVVRGGFVLEAVLAAAAGEVVALMGPNGSGKSTLLGTVAGLLRPSSGHVRVGGRALSTSAEWVPTHERRVGLLGQDPLLFPHLTALQNVLFAAHAAHGASDRARQRASEWLAATEVAEFADRKPHELSGGQQQRVAIARALAAEPDVLLLDEPLASLDVETAVRIRLVLRERLAGSAFTTVLVTHDPVDAIMLVDRVVLLEAGRVIDEGEPSVVFQRPSNTFTAALARNADARG